MLKHLFDHLEIVLTDCANTPNHTLEISVTALFLEVLDFLPESLRNLC